MGLDSLWVSGKEACWCLISICCIIGLYIDDDDADDGDDISYSN